MHNKGMIRRFVWVAAVVAGTVVYAGSALAQDAPSDAEAKQIRERTEPLAEQGNASAQYNMGVIYDEGYGVERDYGKALDWYRKAAEQGFAKAEHNLGILYQEGHGTEADPAEAARWFQRAAEDGEPAAQNNLAVMYVRGQGVPQDLGKAAQWAARAAKAGNKSAISNLPHIAGNLPQSRIDGDNVNIRSLPSTKGQVIRQAGGNTRVVVLARENDWSQVLFPDTYDVGWVADFLLAGTTAPLRAESNTAAENSAPASAAPEASSQPTATAGQQGAGEQTGTATQQTETAAATSGPRMHIGGDVVNIRERPTTNAGVAFQAHRDEQVTVLDKHNDWRHVRFEDGRTGWVAGFLLAD